MIAVAEEPQVVSATTPFWSKEVPQFDSMKQLVRGGMFQHQRDWWELPNFIKALVGGYGAGKTLIGSKRIIGSALENAPCPVAVVSPSFSVARHTVIDTINALLEGKRSIFGKRIWYRYNKTHHEFEIRFRGRSGHIFIYSGEDPLSLRGPNLAAAWVDEPFIQQRAVFDQMIARIRHPLASRRELLLTGTPEELNWGYDICVGDERDKNDVGIVHASTRGNLALDDAYVQRLLSSHTEKAAAAYVEGQFTNLSKGTVYYGFDPSKNKKELEKPEFAAEIIGMDFNVNPMAAIVAWTHMNHMHVFAEYELPNSDTQYMCDYLKERHPNAKDVYPDSSGVKRSTASPGGKSDFTYIREAGFSIWGPSQNPHIKDRYNAVNGKFAPRSGPITLTVSAKCVKLIKYLSLYSHERLNKPEQKAMSHLLDAFGYPVAYLFPVSKDTMQVHKLSGF